MPRKRLLVYESIGFLLAFSLIVFVCVKVVGRVKVTGSQATYSAEEALAILCDGPEDDEYEESAKCYQALVDFPNRQYLLARLCDKVRNEEFASASSIVEIYSWLVMDDYATLHGISLNDAIKPLYAEWVARKSADYQALPNGPQLYTLFQWILGCNKIQPELKCKAGWLLGRIHAEEYSQLSQLMKTSKSEIWKRNFASIQVYNVFGTAHQTPDAP
jgi:hypothetical protein